MKQIFTVFGFTFRDAVRKKAFLVSTVIILLLVLLLCALPRGIALFSGDETGEQAPSGQVTARCYYIDELELIPGGRDALAAAMPDTDFQAGDAAHLEEYRAETAKDSGCSMIVVSEQDGSPQLEVITKDFMSGISAERVSDVLTNHYVAAVLQAQGLDEATIAFAQSQLPYTAAIAGKMDISGYALGIVLTMLIFFAIYYYGYGVAMSVATEKTSRVMETLVVSAKPSRILLGKCLAMGTLGILQFAVILLFGAVCYKLLVPADFMLFGMPLSLSAFTLESALLIVLYFILGYGLYAVMNAVCGASVSKIEDIQSAMMPVLLIAMVSFYFGYFSAISSSGEGLVQKVAMYLPFSSPFIVPFKLLNGSVAAVDLAISIGLLIAAILVVTTVSVKVYSASVLHYGKKMKLRELYKTKL